jgi:hypothetical protein
MPAKSPEAIARKRQRKNARRRVQRPILQREPVTASERILARRMMPRLPEMTKTELRAMLASALRNTAEAT